MASRKQEIDYTTDWRQKYLELRPLHDKILGTASGLSKNYSALYNKITSLVIVLKRNKDPKVSQYGLRLGQWLHDNSVEPSFFDDAKDLTETIVESNKKE